MYCSTPGDELCVSVASFTLVFACVTDPMQLLANAAMVTAAMTGRSDVIAWMVTLPECSTGESASAVRPWLPAPCGLCFYCAPPVPYHRCSAANHKACAAKRSSATHGASAAGNLGIV